MNHTGIAVEMRFESTPPGTDDQFEAFLDAIQEHLDALGREVQMAARLSDRIAEFAISVTDGNFQMAAAGLLVDLRTALHAAGCNTPGWPRYEATDHSVRELQDA